MAKRGPQPKTGNMEPPAYSLCETVPKPPPWLSKIGGVLWEVTAQELFDRGLLTVVALAPLEIYCAAYARTRAMNERIETEGCTIMTPKGWPAPNPEVAMAAQQAKLMLSLAEKFGFTPSSQSRIAIVPEQTAPVDPLEAARADLAEMGTARPS